MADLIIIYSVGIKRMNGKVMLDSKKVIDKVFSPAANGYKALEVDHFLDIVANDYDELALVISKLEKELENTKKSNEELSKQNYDLEAKLALYENKVSLIGDNLEVSRSNLDLLNRIKNLENALYKAGIDPTKIK